jgi:hypothetical protein
MVPRLLQAMVGREDGGFAEPQQVVAYHHKSPSQVMHQMEAHIHELHQDHLPPMACVLLPLHRQALAHSLHLLQADQLLLRTDHPLRYQHPQMDETVGLEL